MEYVASCDDRALARLSRAIETAAKGHPMAVSVEGGVHREYRDGDLLEVANGTLTITIRVNGGARDSGDAKREVCEVGGPVYWGDMKGRPEYVRHAG